MTSAQRKYQKNQELTKAYITEHPELNRFVSILERAAKTNINVRFKISIGQATNEGNHKVFLSYLTSCISNPRILFTAADSEPMILISGKSCTLASICLADMGNLKIETEDCTGCTFDRYTIRFTLEKPTGKLDYDMNIVIDK